MSKPPTQEQIEKEFQNYLAELKRDSGGDATERDVVMLRAGFLGGFLAAIEWSILQYETTRTKPVH